ncbi:TerD family protein [Verrucomicrobium sp. BvORR034]|uniref:TerD family protein n=1 Tax=Verrucomicrobium sp. BvORR034 TaxID=1396418 RepID=UPI0006788C78|nr:TerD family protein [Verrucomicrobium sp. BvORR034]
MTPLARGQKSTLSSLGVGISGLKVQVTLRVPAPSTVDLSCFGLDSQGRLSDERYFVFYNQPASPCGSIRAKGAAGSVDQTFELNLAGLPAGIKRLVFTAAIDGAATMKDISTGYVQVGDFSRTAAEFRLQPTDYAGEKALMLIELYWKDEWRLAATGQGFNGGLAALLKHFGGEVAEEKQKPAAVAPVSMAAPVPPPLPAKVSLSKITLTKPGQTHRVSLEKGAGAPAKLIVKASWTDNGDDSDSNDDLDLRVGMLLPDGRMKFIQAPDFAGSFDAMPFARHLGDVTVASLNAPATETVEVNPAIAQRMGGRVGMVFSVYSAVSNGAVSVASLRPIMKMEYGNQVVECAFDFMKIAASKDDTVYSYVIGLAVIDAEGITLEPSGLTSLPGSENTPWLQWTPQGGLNATMDGPAVFKGSLAGKAASFNKNNPRRYI